MRIGWPIDIHGCVKRLAGTSRSSITNQCHVVAELHADASRRFYTSVSPVANDDDFLLAAFAISSGVPKRPSGTLATRLAISCSPAASFCASRPDPAFRLGPD
jgi:hypothetical protein